MRTPFISYVIELPSDSSGQRHVCAQVFPWSLERPTLELVILTCYKRVFVVNAMLSG